jgi:hypothetical protein
MEESRLNSLTILSIEADLIKTINFNDFIESFASQKSKKNYNPMIILL